MKTTQDGNHGGNDGGGEGVVGYGDVTTRVVKASFGKVVDGQKQISKRIPLIKYDIEQTLLEVQAIVESMINKLLSTFSVTINRKRTFLDIDKRINFVDIEKDFQSISDQFDGWGSNVDSLMTLSDLREKVITGYGGRGGDQDGRSGGGDGYHIPEFLHKLYNMVTNDDIDDLISWNLPCRDAFIIWDINKFATRVLPMYFKHTNFSSFNRQLNVYGFKKVCWKKHEYVNEWFRGGRYDLIVNIKSRNKNLQAKGFAITWSATEAEMFNKRLKAIQHDQENKSMWLSNYEAQMKSAVCEFKETVINMANVVDNMIQRSSEKLENVKKTKAEFKKDIIGNGEGQESEVNEVKTTSRESNNQEDPPYLKELEIDPKC